VLRRLVIDLSELDQFKHFDAALTGLAFREEGVRPAHACGYVPLRQPCFLTGQNQLFDKSVIQSLMLRRPALAGHAGLRFFLFLHLSSVGNP
jgi:hypothetical protein